MKGNTIVRKMKQLGNITANCMEAGSELVWEQKFLKISHKKELARLGRIMNKAQKKLDNIWHHNVPRTALKAEVDMLSRDHEKYVCENCGCFWNQPVTNEMDCCCSPRA